MRLKSFKRRRVEELNLLIEQATDFELFMKIQNFDDLEGIFAVFPLFRGRFFKNQIKQYKSNIFYLLFFLKMWDFKHLA